MSDEKWKAELNSYAERPGMSGWVITYDPTPGGRKNDNGSISYSLRFPALVLPDLLEDPYNAAKKIAAALNRDEAATALDRLSGRVTVSEEAKAIFADWFRKNYPGPDTRIYRPDWHAPKILSAAAHALNAAIATAPTPSPDQIRREAARSLLADFEAEKLPDHAIDAADDMHSEGDSGNTSDIIEAFLKALITGGDDVEK